MQRVYEYKASETFWPSFHAIFNQASVTAGVWGFFVFIKNVIQLYKRKGEEIGANFTPLTVNLISGDFDCYDKREPSYMV